MKRFSFVLVSMMVLSLVSCAPQLTILHVNDTHSHHEPMRGYPRNGGGGIIERGAIVDSVRAVRGDDNVLLVHAGDWNQGSSYYTRFGGDLEVNVVNAFQYDVITLGNHEFDNGLEDLLNRLERVKCPVVCSNVAFSSACSSELISRSSVIKPYAVITKAGRRVGFIGLAPNLKTNVSSKVSSLLTQSDNVKTVNMFARYLRDVEKCDLVVVLSHLGYEEDLMLVPQTKGVSLIIGGHSHTFVEDLVYVRDAAGKKVPVVTDGCWGYDIGEVKLR